MRKAGDKATAHGIATQRHDDWDGLGRSLGGTDRRGRRGDDHVNVEPHQLCGKVEELLEPTLRVSRPDCYALPFNVTEVAETPAERFLAGRWGECRENADLDNL